MLNKHEVLELLKYHIYKVEVRLLSYPYISKDDTYVIGGVKIDISKPSIDQALFNYVHTEESIHKGIFDRGYAIYYLQLRGAEVHEVDGQLVKELSDTVDIDIESKVFGVTDDGLYKIHKQY